MARNRKHRKHAKEEINETWLLPYADMLTLLLALFIVLFSMSSIDAQKFRDIAQSLSTVFNSGTGVMDYPSPNEVIVPANGSGKEDELAAKAELESLREMQERIDKYIQENNLENRLSTKLSGEGLQITILDNALFDSGSAEIKDKAYKLGVEISNLIVSDPPRYVTISGHTDNVPIHNENYKSNWHLSVMRAVNFMEVLLENPKIQPEYLNAKGHGEHKPIAPNDTEENRAKNRRVEVLITPNYEINLEDK